MAEIQKVEVIPSSSEVKFHRSEFASVVFHNVAEMYPADAHVDCLYTITADITATTRDWVGLYKVGWISAKDYVYYEWAPMPKNYKPKTDVEGEILFQAHTLPKEDGEFYQFCYVSSSGQIRGASTPFQFKAPSADDFVEYEEEEMDLLVIRSKTAVLMENLDIMEEDNKKLKQLKEKMEGEIKSLVDKVKTLNKSLENETSQRAVLSERLQASEARLEEMLCESNDMTLVHDELKLKVDALTESKTLADNAIAEKQEELLLLQVKLKVLQSEKDELDGKNQTITEEMNLYKTHLSKSENSASEYMHEIEILKTRLDEYSSTVTELRGKLEQNAQMMTKCKEEICTLKSQLYQETQKLDKQVSVTQAEKDNTWTLIEKLRNVEDRLEAAERTKDMMRVELGSYQDAQNKISTDLATSKSDCLCIKEQMEKMEQDFLTEISVLHKEHDSAQKDLGNVLKEKEELQAKVCQLQDDLDKMQNNLDSTSAPIYALKNANDVLKGRLVNTDKIISEKNAEIAKINKKHLRNQHDLLREVEDLKERIMMCTEEYKRLYVENKKCHKKLDKLLQRKPHDVAEVKEPKIHKEKLQQSSKPGLERRVSERRSSSSSELSVTPEELQTQVDQLRQELEKQMTKKEKYKKMYLDEKESENALRQHYYEQLQQRDEEIEKLKLLKCGDLSEIEHKMRMMENCLNHKEKEIDELNQKLRTSKLRQLWSVWEEATPEEGPKPTKRTSLNKSEVKEDVKLDAIPASNAAQSEVPALIYGNPYIEESVKLSQEGAAAASAAASTAVVMGSYSIAYPPPPHEPAHYAETGEITTDEHEEVSTSSQTFVAPVRTLPIPLQPEVLPTARVAALKATLPWTEKQVMMFESGMSFPSAPPESYAERIVSENGDVIKKCPLCDAFFESESIDFGMHYMEHFGRICPICHLQADDTVSKEDFEYHVNCCIEKDNGCE